MIAPCAPAKALVNNCSRQERQQRVYFLTEHLRDRFREKEDALSAVSARPIARSRALGVTESRQTRGAPTLMLHDDVEHGEAGHQPDFAAAHFAEDGRPVAGRDIRQRGKRMRGKTTRRGISCPKLPPGPLNGQARTRKPAMTSPSRTAIGCWKRTWRSVVEREIAPGSSNRVNGRGMRTGSSSWRSSRCPFFIASSAAY